MTQEPEKPDPDKLSNSNPEKKIWGIDVSDVPKFLSWSSLGGTGGLCINFLMQGDWTKAAIFFLLFVITASWGLIWAFGKSFLDTMKDGLEGMGKTSGEQVLENLEQQRKISAEKFLQNAARETEIKQLTDFESRYLEEQKDTCHRDEADGVREEDHLDNYPVLQEIFVPLRLIDNPRELGFNRYEDLEDGQISDIWQLLRNSQDKEKLKRISIRARGGYGKTTLLKYLAYTYSNRAYGDYKAPKFIPFLLYLSRCVKLINQDDSLELTQLLTDHAHKLLENQECTAPDDWAKNLLLNGQALVMLDGFDEIPSSEERVKVSAWLNREMQKYRKSVFILTSRPTAYRLDYPNKKHFMNYWINDFDDKQRQEFLEKWYIYQEGKAARGLDRGIEKKAKTRAKSLLDQIDARPELKALSGNALMLNMMVRYHRDKKGKDLPQRKFELYRGILELQLDRRPTEKGITLLLNSAAERQKVLQLVALVMMQQVTNSTKNDDEGFKQISHEHLIESIEQGLTNKGWTIKADEFLKQMVDVSELLVKRDENYEFSHLSFQSFLAAWELYDLKEEGEKLIYAKSSLDKWKEIDAWKDAFVFYANLVDPNQLIQKLVDLYQDDLADFIYRQLDRADIAAPIRKLVTNNLYQQLEEYLENQQWYEADQETWKLILKVTNREEEGWVRVEDVKNFPCEDLLTLDRLWVEYSKKHGFEFGFSVQKQIYVECGGKLDFSYPSVETWDKFLHPTAWKSEGNWVGYPDQFYKNNFMIVKGHLPVARGTGGGRARGEGGWRGYFFSRIATCEV
jgi:predicted NACHT family NTPase